MPVCVLCSASAVVNRQDNGSRTIYNCPICGVFVVSDLAQEDVKKNTHALASYMAARHLAKTKNTLLISYDNAKQDKDYVQMTVEQITQRFPQTFSEKLDLSLLNLAHLSGYPGGEFILDNLEVWPYFYLDVVNYDALSFVVKALQKSDLVNVNYYASTFFPCGIIVSPKGWDRITSLNKGTKDGNHAFLVFPRAEATWSLSMRLSVRKAVESCGFHTVESSWIHSDNLVGYAMIAQVKRSKIIICDLSSDFQAGYYCAALGLALEKTVLLTCHESQKHKLKMETSDIHVLVWKDHKELYNSITNQIQAFIP